MSSDEEFPDFYRLLMVSRDATQEQIKQAYRKQMKYWHPDTFHDHPEEYRRQAHEMTVKLGEAYEYLRSPAKRQQYDELLTEWDNRAAGVEQEPDHDPDLQTLLTAHGMEVIDKRPQGGALWAVGGSELADFFAEMKGRGITFDFAQNGGRATRHRPAWYTTQADPHQ